MAWACLPHSAGNARSEPGIILSERPSFDFNREWVCSVIPYAHTSSGGFRPASLSLTMPDSARP